MLTRRQTARSLPRQRQDPGAINLRLYQSTIKMLHSMQKCGAGCQTCVAMMFCGVLLANVQMSRRTRAEHGSGFWLIEHYERCLAPAQGGMSELLGRHCPRLQADMGAAAHGGGCVICGAPSVPREHCLQVVDELVKERSRSESPLSTSSEADRPLPGEPGGSPLKRDFYLVTKAKESSQNTPLNVRNGPGASPLSA